MRVLAGAGAGAGAFYGVSAVGRYLSLAPQGQAGSLPQNPRGGVLHRFQGFVLNFPASALQGCPGNRRRCEASDRSAILKTLHLVGQLKVWPRLSDRFGFDGGLVDIKLAQYRQDLLFAALVGEPGVGECGSLYFVVGSLEDVWGQQELFEQALQRGPEGVVDDAGPVTPHPLDLPDDCRQIVQIDLLIVPFGLISRCSAASKAANSSADLVISNGGGANKATSLLCGVNSIFLISNIDCELLAVIKVQEVH